MWVMNQKVVITQSITLWRPATRTRPADGHQEEDHEDQYDTGEVDHGARAAKLLPRRA